MVRPVACAEITTPLRRMESRRGAGPGDILRLVMGLGVVFAAVGIAVGLCRPAVVRRGLVEVSR